jgi:hypothetical protein
MEARMMEPSPVLVTIREDLARRERAAALSSAVHRRLAEIYPLLIAAQDAIAELAEASSDSEARPLLEPRAPLSSRHLSRIAPVGTVLQLRPVPLRVIPAAVRVDR